MNEFFQDTGTVVDPLYQKVRNPANPYCLKARNLIERMWSASGQFVDSDTRERAKLDFSAAWWELYLAFALLELGVSLLPNEKKPRLGKGRPDLVSVSPRVWIEAVAPEAGIGPDALTEPEAGRVFDVPIESYILRLRNAIQNKIQVIDRYILNGTIPSGESVIIAISGSRLPFRFTEGPIPNIVRAVFGVGNMVLEFDVTTRNHMNTSLEYKDHVLKKSNQPVATDLFLRKESEHVSAILYSASDCVNHPPQPGPDFILVHNPNAQVPVPESWLLGVDQYWMDEQVLRRVPSSFE
ncbi:MAG TPA: hypothetical protein VGK22_14295 [Candidatus Angelobacter sp.]|jgi:hypothetical protein